MRTLHRVLVVLALVHAVSVSQAFAQNRLPLDAPRPIEAVDSLSAEELTSMEIRDTIRTGITTIIIGTGGVEQNGPYVAGGKHNYVLQTVLPDIARAIGQALIAPIVKFVPEGNIEPKTSGHMQYAGTISLERRLSRPCSLTSAAATRHMASWTSSCWAIAAGTRQEWNGWRRP